MGHRTQGRPSLQKEGVLNQLIEEASLEVLGDPQGTRGESTKHVNAWSVRGAMNKIRGQVESGSLTCSGQRQKR